MGAERRDGELKEALTDEANGWKSDMAEMPMLHFQPAHYTDIGKQIADLCEQRLALTAYLLSKVKAGDWHAVQDAASDIREIEAKLSVLRA
jgi:hypothetical protein